VTTTLQLLVQCSVVIFSKELDMKMCTYLKQHISIVYYHTRVYLHLYKRKRDMQMSECTNYENI
jgi:hypothetical protein